MSFPKQPSGSPEVGSPPPAPVGPTELEVWLRPQATPLPTRPNSDYAEAVRLGLRILVFGLGGFLLWATLAPLDEGVPAQGTLAVDSKRKRIDHMLGGLVEKILVREGQRVNEGDELVVLNETQTRATLNATQNQWYTAVATQARLEAERDSRQIRFPATLKAASASDPDARVAMDNQHSLLQSRRTALEGELRIIRESVKGLEDQLASLNQMRTGRERQVELFNTQLEKFQRLNRQGFVSQNQLLELERQLSEIQSKQSEDLANIGGINARLAEFRMRSSQRLIEHRREVETQLAEVQKEATTLAERLTAISDSHARLTIRAPVAGTVVDVAVHTVGGVVKPGDRLMDIVPNDDQLVVEAQLPPQYIDRVRPGLAADVHFDAYVSLMARPVLSGEVVMVSADILTDPRSGAAFYTLKVSIPGSQLAKLGDVRLHPGMQGTVMVKTGERTFLSYLLRPLLKRFMSALSES